MNWFTNFFFMRNRIKELTQDNMRMNRQLTEANAVVIFYAKLQAKCQEGPYEVYNFNKAVGYCHQYNIPLFELLDGKDNSFQKRQN